MTELAHAVLSASGADRWMQCPGSRAAEKGYGDSSSPFAEEGTLAHELADQCLKTERDAEYYVGKKILDKIIERDMAEYVQDYLNYVRSFEHENTTLYTEERVDFSHVVPEGFGTLDSSVMDHDTGVLHIFDLKYGKGVQVDAVGNRQGRLYGVGMINELDWLYEISSVNIHIHMPRKGGPSNWHITREELQEFAEEAREAALLAMTDDAPRIPGEKQCQWCKAKGDCPALMTYIEETLAAEFDDLDDVPFDEDKLKPHQKEQILRAKKTIMTFIDAVEMSVIAEFEAGNKVPGFKMVEGRSNRKLTEDAEDFIVEQLGEENAYNRKLIPLGTAEKLIGKNKLKPYWTKAAGAPTLAFEDDKREAIDVTSDVSDMFDDVDD